MKTFRIVTSDDTGSRTQDIVARDMSDALNTAMGNLKTKNLTSIRTVTCTTL